jgi:hypothetical protein
LAYSADALAPKKAGLFQGRYDAAAGTFKTEQLRAASFDEFQLDATSAAASPAGQLYTADGAPLMTAPCCIKVVGVGGGGGNAVNRMVERVAPRPSNSEPAVTHPRTPVGRTRAPSWTFGP